MYGPSFLRLPIIALVGSSINKNQICYYWYDSSLNEFCFNCVEYKKPFSYFRKYVY